MGNFVLAGWIQNLKKKGLSDSQIVNGAIGVAFTQVDSDVKEDRREALGIVWDLGVAGMIHSYGGKDENSHC